MKTIVTRTISGICFVLAMLGGLLFNKYIFAVLIMAIMAICLVEFYTMTIGRKHRWISGLAVLTGIIFFVLLFCYCTLGMKANFVSLSILPVFVIMVMSLFSKDRESFGEISHIYTGLLYIAIPFSLSNLIAFDSYGEFTGRLLLCFFVIIWCSDVGAYSVGIAFGKGRKKLFPSVSPNKTWIGAWGGMAFAILAAIILHKCGLLLPGHSIVHPIVLAALLDAAGVFGDLFESQWKRWSGIKDSGNIIPGHGGMLDRFDSAIFAVPVGAVYLSLFGLL
jgi:phosphatidate cytidylyltransferase